MRLPEFRDYSGTEECSIFRAPRPARRVRFERPEHPENRYFVAAPPGGGQMRGRLCAGGVTGGAGWQQHGAGATALRPCMARQCCHGRRMVSEWV